MKFEDFIKTGQVKYASKDIQMSRALISAAEQDMLFLKPLKLGSLSARKIISNYYDILRSLFEADAILNGFKIYSHEAFTYYLIKNNKETESRKFERFRKIRNSINYYGKQVSADEAKEIVEEIKELIDKIKIDVSTRLSGSNNE